jgi:hypothetical protein
MSAYKTAVIRLGESEYRRLRDAEEQLRLMELSQADRENETSMDPAIFERIAGQNKNRNREFQNAIGSLDQEVKAIERNTTQWVQSQLQQVEVQIEQSQEQFAGRNDQILSALIDQFNDAIGQHSQDLSQQFMQQESRLESIETRLDLYRQEAKKWIEASTKLHEFILDHYNLDANTANALEFEVQRLNIAIDQFNQGLVESACSAGLENYFYFSQIHAQLEAKEVMRMVHYERLVGLAAQIRDRIERQLHVHAMDVDGNELSEVINVDFWTEGAYADLVDDFNELLAFISNHPGLMEADIEENRNRLIDIETRSIELVTQARMGVLSSQLRFNIAQIVVQALETQGFNLEEARFNRSDYRDAFTATTRNLSGNEVVVTIDPSPNLEEGGKLHIASTDGTLITEHELLQRNREIFKAIDDAGLDVSNIQAGDSPIQEGPVENKRIQHTDGHRIHNPLEKNSHGRR